MACGRHAVSKSQPTRIAALGLGLGDALGASWVYVRAWIERTRQRHALDDLDERLLRDIGVSRSAAQREIDKYFWRP